jgi:thiamine pyrophosphate-dependent acetolactate synthase large subunit-like protein
MAKRVADIVVETLQAAGVKHRWGVPGDTLNFVTDAIRRGDIEWVHVRHEEVAGFAAGAEAMLTGDLTACAGSCGPGSLHFINGLFESHRNRAPVVLIASQIIFDEIGFDFPQEVDYGPIYKSCSVFCDEIRTPAQARRKTAMAAQAALSKRGVAVLVLPIDVSKAHAPDEPAFAVKATPNRQVISLSGDGGQSMLLGDLITAVQEKIPIKIAVFNNGSLGFVELEMKVEGLLDTYTNLENPDFARVAQAIGFHAQRVERAEELEVAVRDWIAAPGPALLDVVTDRMELVIPPKIEIAQVFGTALYSAKAVLSGSTGDVWELVTDNLA